MRINNIRCSKKEFLRDVIGTYMPEIGKKDSRVVVVNADLMGTCRNKTFCEMFPDRAFNVGIAEQNMVSFAAGLAHEGFMPFVFSMAPFISMRACEQCRTDVAYGNLNVRFVANYSGMSGGISGATHWAVEDCGIMSSMPGMTVLEPSDAVQAKNMLDATIDYNGPVYIRSSIEAVQEIYSADYRIEFGKSSLVHDGTDGAILCSGVVVQYALEAVVLLKKEIGIDIRVVDMYSIKPIDKDAIISAAKTGCILVAQDHNVIGGLGSLVATVIAEEGIATKFRILGLKDKFVPMAHADYLYRMFEIDTKGLYENMLNMLNIKC